MGKCQRSRKLRLASIEIVLVLLIGVMSMFIPFTPVAQAAAPSLNSSCTTGQNIGFGGSSACVLSSVSPNDVVVYVLNSARDTKCENWANGDATDNRSLINFITGPNSCNNYSTHWRVNNAIWYGLYTGTTTKSEQISVSKLGMGGELTAEVFAFSGVVLTGLTQSTDTNSSGARCTACTTLNDQVTSFALQDGVTIWGGTGSSVSFRNKLTVPTGYTAVQQIVVANNLCNWGGAAPPPWPQDVESAGCAAYKFGTSGTSTLATTDNSGGSDTLWMNSVALSLASGTVVTVTTIAACTFVQLQCWAYPLMFLMMFMSFFIGTGMTFAVSEKGFLYLILSGATIGSIVEIQMGIMTIMMPLLLIMANVAYSFRLDRLVTSATSAVSGGKQNETE